MVNQTEIRSIEKWEFPGLKLGEWIRTSVTFEHEGKESKIGLVTDVRDDFKEIAFRDDLEKIIVLCYHGPGSFSWQIYGSYHEKFREYDIALLEAETR